MGRMTITLPRLGETMEEAKVLAWLVAPGTGFARGEVLLEVETDKAVVEVPALVAGVLLAQLAAPGDTLSLDQPMAEIETEDDTAEAAPAPAAAVEPPAAATTAAPTPPAATGRRPVARPAASPAARAAARAAGLDLATLRGSGRRGRIMGWDVAPDGPLPRPANAPGLQIVLLHGLFDDHRGWRDLPRRLQAAGHPVLAMDLPGHGAAAAAGGFEAVVDAIEARLPGGPLCLVGHSLGGAIAARLAVRLAERVVRMVLSAPVGIGARLNAGFTDGMLNAETPAALARALALLDAGPVSAMALAAELDRLRSLRPGHAALTESLVRGGIQQIDIAADLAHLVCPVSVIFGTADRILEWHDIAHLPAHVAIHLVRGAGHLPHLAAPDLIASLADSTPFGERRTAPG